MIMKEKAKNAAVDEVKIKKQKERDANLEYLRAPL